jgi:hypothetical protein
MFILIVTIDKAIRTLHQAGKLGYGKIMDTYMPSSMHNLLGDRK